jgi:hypothetical protein
VLYANSSKPVSFLTSRVLAAGIATFLLGTFLSVVTAQETRRTWSSKSGKFKVEAEFVRVEDEQVVLKKVSDGKTIKVKFADLTAADVKIAKELAAATEENPFAGGEDEDKGSSSKPSKSGDASQVVESPGRGSVETILLLNADNWDYKPDAEPASDLKLKSAIPIPKPKRPEKDAEIQRLSFHDGLDNGLFVWGRGEYIAMLRNPFLDRDGKGGGPLLVRYDLSTGKSKPPKKPGFKTAPRFASPDGKLVIGWDDQDRERIDLHVMTLDDAGGLKMQYRWLPLAKDEHWDYQNELKFVGNDRIAVHSTKGNIDVWQIGPDTASLLYTITAEQHNSTWTASRGGKYLAITQKDAVFFIDVADGKIAGKLSGGEEGFTTASFSPDGKQMALANNAVVTVIDLETQKSTGSVRFQSPIMPNSIEFPAPDYVLINGSFLVNMSLNVVAWEYTSPGGWHNQPQWRNGALWYRTAVAGNDAIARAKIPHDAALNAVKGLDSANLYVLKPGGQVALVVNENGPERDDIIRGLTEKLKKVGIDVVPSANMAFICETEQGKQKTVPYRLFGGNEQSVTVTEKTHRIRLMDGQKKVWEGASFHSAPFFISLSQNETVEQHVAKTMNTSKFYFLGINIPGTIVRYPEGKNSLGSSELTVGGP